MTALGYIVYVFILCHVGHALRKDYVKGLAWCLFYLVCLPHGMRIETSGVLPEITIHRAILVMAFFVRVFQQRSPILRRNIPAYALIVALLASYGASVFCSDFPGDSIKALLAAFFENMFIYFLLISCLVSFADAKRCVAAACCGVAISASIAITEYYKAFNLVTLLVPNHASVISGGSVGCYEHEILNGYIMAMTVPLLMALSGTVATARHRWLWRFLLLLVMAACYCAQKRGPWLGCMFGAGTLAVLATKEIRREMRWIGVLFLVLVITMPGVRETICDRLNSVFIHNDEQDASAEYRLILWTVAWDKITKSPGRLIFGLGGMATEHMDIKDYFAKERGGQVMTQGYSSWDSQWAANLVQYGLLGFAIELALRCAILFYLFKRWKTELDPACKALTAAVCATVGIYMWAMLTVAIFSPQLKYMLWGVTSVALFPLYRLRETKADDRATDMSEVNEEVNEGQA